jgi:hypothetical protein
MSAVTVVSFFYWLLYKLSHGIFYQNNIQEYYFSSQEELYLILSNADYVLTFLHKAAIYQNFFGLVW